MKKSVVIPIIILFFSIINSVGAEQQVSTIDITFGYTKSTKSYRIYESDISVDIPDGISKILSSTMYIYGDFQPSTSIYLMINDKPCNPSYWTTPNDYVYDYKVKFDCRNVLSKDKSGKYKIKFMSTKDAYNIFGGILITYFDKEDYVVKLKGTEYKSGQPAKIFLQLLDENERPISNSDCFVTILSPDNSIYKYKQLMYYVDEGIYVYDTTAPYVGGNYPLSAFCLIPNVTVMELSAYDDFECGGWNCGSGWNSDWYHGGGANIQGVSAYEGNYGMNLKGSNPYANRLFYSNLTSVSISFYARAGSFETGEYVRFYFCDADNNCTIEEEWVNGEDDNVWRHYTYTFHNDTRNLNGLLSINFTGVLSSSYDWLHIDNISITLIGNVTTNITEYKIVRGSGEMHITPDDKLPIIVETKIDKFTDKYFDGNEYEYEEGLITYNITIISQYVSDNYTAEFSFETPYKVGCTALEEFQKWNGSEWVDDISSIVGKEQGSLLENCRFTIMTTIDSGDVQRWRMNLDNYQKWEVEWTKDFLEDLKPRFEEYCHGIGGNYTYDVPITKNMTISDDKIINLCHRVFDDYYWFETTYNESINATPEVYESYLQEINFYREEIYKRFEVLGIGYATPKLVWNETNRTLTDYNMTGIIDLILSLNDTINSRYDDISDMITSTNITIHNTIENVNETLYTLSHNMNSSIFSKLYSIQDELSEINNNLTEIYSYIGDANYTIMNKLYSLQYEISSLNSTINEINISINNNIDELSDEITDILLNITNATINITLSQEELLTTMIGLWGDRIGRQTAYMSFTGFFPLSYQNDVHYYCKDNETLVSERYITRFVSGAINKTFTISEIDEIKCTYGCANNMCVVSTYDTIIMILVLFVIAFFIYYFAFRKHFVSGFIGEE
ncbi:MAG: hypothetical protein DRN81_03625 [Thermoproteota archaeon]|nr:MAG: hypothetical protein DRN81_03625 [Candidatus Korarchaeota archaeon]